MIYGTYIQLIQFCSSLPIRQLIAYKNQVKHLKNKPYLVATEVLKIRMKKINIIILQSTTRKD